MSWPEDQKRLWEEAEHTEFERELAEYLAVAEPGDVISMGSFPLADTEPGEHVETEVTGVKEARAYRRVKTEHDLFFWVVRNKYVFVTDKNFDAMLVGFPEGAGGGVEAL